MKTVLVLTASAASPTWLTEALGPGHHLVPLVSPAATNAAPIRDLFQPWLGLADVVVVDAASMQESARWALESLATWPRSTALVVRLSAMQQSLFPADDRWLVLKDSDSTEHDREALQRFLALHDAERQLASTRSHAAGQAGPVPWAHASEVVATAQTQRYRSALQKILQLLGERTDPAALPGEFTCLVADLLGVGRAALLVPPSTGADQANDPPAPAEAWLSVIASRGLRREVVDHLRLSLAQGIGGYLARENKILRRPHASAGDPQMLREFELLGAEVVVPMFDQEHLVGALALNGRVTGETLTNDELELVYQLLGHLARAWQHLALQRRVESQQRFTQEVLQQIETGLVMVDPQGLVMHFNPRAGELLGWQDRAALGQPLRNLPGRFADALFEVLQTGQSLRRHEIVLPRGQRPLGLNVSRLATADGPVVVALLEDLTQIKREEEQVRASADREFFTRVSFRLSHELKNSLASIKVFGQLLPERYAEKDFREQFSQIVVNEVNRVDVLVNNLTFFAQPLGLVYEEVTLTDLIDTCTQNLARELERKKIARLVNLGDKSESTDEMPLIGIKRNFAHRVPLLEADRLRLMQGLEHILRNASQSMPSGGRVSINTADATAEDFGGGPLPEGGGVRIEIHDTGEGIPLELLPRVTEPFVTTRNVGVGLGLTIVKKIVDRHSGRLTIDSLLGRGTTVTLVLPAAIQPHPEDKLLAELARAEAAASDRGESDVMNTDRLAVAAEKHRRQRSAPPGLGRG